MEKRQRWDSRMIFIFAAIGSAAGLGNAWRFPYMAASNGGGAFLIPYFIALVTAGIPILILEFAMGNKFQAGAPTAYGQINEKHETIGWLAIFVSFGIIVYYIVILAWVFDYLWYAVTSAWGNAPADFFLHKVLQISEGPGTLGGFSVPVLIGWVIAWIAVYLSIKDGTKSVGKVVKWTVPLPIIMLGILLIRGITLPGAAEGINYYLAPNFSKLLDPKVWAAAYGQIFFSLSVAFGVMVAYASYLPKKSDITNNAIITALSNCGISFMAGFAVFGTMGYMAMSKGAAIADVAGSGGVGLAFWVYPEAINLLPFGNIIFGLVFFIMLLTLGIDSAFSLVEGVVAGISDKFGTNKKKTTQWVCIVAAAISLIFTTKAGLYWLDITDRYINNFAIIGVALLEAIVVGWIFGVEKLRNFTNEFSEVKLGSWFNILMKYICPFALGIILVWNVIQEIIDINNGTLYEGYPLWAIAVGGWAVLGLIVVVSLIFSIGKSKAKENA